MSEREHALLSASSANQWLSCPPSVRATENMPDTDSEYAQRGTLAHRIGELTLRKQYKLFNSDATSVRKINALLKEAEADPLYEVGMKSAVGVYVDHVANVVHSFPSPPLIFIEQRVDYSHIAPEGFGTADCIVIGSGRMHIIDYKNGSGVPVSAENNPQMKLYALGALRMFGMLYSIQTCWLTIVQPNVAEEPSTWETDTRSLLAWGEAIKPVAEQAYKGEGEFRPAPGDSPEGDWCRWCKMRANCRARADLAVREDFKDLAPLPTLTPAELAEAIKKARILKPWLEAAEEYALSELLNGNEIPGFKAVEGTSRRAIADVDKLFGLLVNEGTDRAVLYESKPVGITALNNLLGKARMGELQEQGHIIKPQGKPTLVPESDKRPPFEQASAEDDFKHLATQ